MVGSTLDAVIPERLRQRHNEGFRAAMACGSTRYGAAEFLAVPARHADGRTVSIEFSVVLLQADDGSVGHVAAILRDVTERRAREQELRRRIETLEGSFSAYAVVPAERCYCLPDGVDPALAAAVANPAATAYLALFVHGHLRAGQRVYVGGGGGNVGSAAIAIARRAGAKVVASARPADYDRCLEASAEDLVDYHDPDLARCLRGAVPDGIDLFWETSGHHDLDLAAGALAPRGRVILSAATEELPVLPVGDLYTRDVSLCGFVISRATVSELADAARLLDTMLATGQLSARIAEVLPLNATAEVHAWLEAGTATGRLLVRL
jgi:NADPH:quinone reductase-like Zn-dependent oxidoreductase